VTASGAYSENKNIAVAKDLFAIADRDKSGMSFHSPNEVHLFITYFDRNILGSIDIYEYLLALGLMQNPKPELTMKCLFKLCDSDHDGFLTEDEIIDAVFTTLKMDATNNVSEEDLKQGRDEMKASMKKVFADKTKISEQEFSKLCAENEVMQELNSMLQFTFGWTMAYALQKPCE
jgi:hypothetical protein